MRAVQLTAFGNPVDGLEYVDIPEPDAPGPNQVLIGVEFSPINPNDLLLAMGIYAYRPALPTVIGNEGVGRVLAVGPGVENVKVGDRVAAPLSSFAWRERMVISANGLFALPPDADPQQLAMLAINPPTAALLLSEYVTLNPGEWVVQNAANSGVGRWVIAFAKTRGLKTVNIVRRPELVAELEAIGGDVVVVDSPDVSERIKAAVGQAELRLALDGVSPGDGRARGDALAPRYARQLCGHELESDVNQPAGRYLQACHHAGLLHGPPGVCGQTCASRSAGGRDDRVRPAAHTSGGNLPPLLHQGSRRACATRRKDSSERSRIIHLIPELAFDRCSACPYQESAMTMTADKVAGTAHVSWVRWGLRPVDDYVDADNPVRFIEAFVDEVDLATAGFVRVEAKATGRPGYAPAEGGLPVGVPCVRAALPAARPLWARAACRGWGANQGGQKQGSQLHSDLAARVHPRGRRAAGRLFTAARSRRPEARAGRCR
jgi:NADPH:quinone reductase-like Zn-dependent oxidoreductase